MAGTTERAREKLPGRTAAAGLSEGLTPESLRWETSEEQGGARTPPRAAMGARPLGLPGWRKPCRTLVCHGDPSGVLDAREQLARRALL